MKSSLKKFVRLGAVVALLSLMAACAEKAIAPPPSSAGGDPRVHTALDSLGLAYEVDGDGDFKLLFKLDDGRTQVAFVNSRTERYKEMEIREVWSPGYRSEGPLNAKVANRLLHDSFSKKLGAWQLMGGDKGRIAVFTVKMAADSPAQMLGEFLGLVVSAADKMERSLTGTDDL